MSQLLGKIIQTKKAEVEALKKDEKFRADLRELQSGVLKLPSPPSFGKAIFRPQGAPLRIIAESKKASPSLGLIRPDYDALENARTYKRLGAAAVSVLTDRTFFEGTLRDLIRAKGAGLPLLRKDFTISEFQIYEAALAGASAVLLIVRILSEDQLKEFYELSRNLGLDALIETHNEEEIELALKIGARIIGINHRNLDTLEMDLALTARMAPRIRKAKPDATIIAESGIESPEGLASVDASSDAVLVGSALMQSDRIEKAWQKIFLQPPGQAAQKI